MVTIPEQKGANLADEHWVAEYKNSGDLQVLGKLYKNYMPLVYGVCLKYFKHPEESQDAVMQIFEQLIDKLKNHEVKNFKSWLYVLTRNFCLMELRKSKKVTTVNIEDTFVESDALLHHDDNDTRENRLLLMEACLGTLVEEQKKTLQLFYLEQKCYTEVADKTGYELKKVKSYIQNGKRNLKICIERSSE
ncbi:MAG TPA: sigma-70 family RNA polymerase sigma factor [Pelobium sp.]|nr:sigma-70 family RNA polymerase sigma factor [Pelobium sp.]